jgi:hypothetical protein
LQQTVTRPARATDFQVQSRTWILIRTICLSVGVIVLFSPSLAYAQKSAAIQEKEAEVARRSKALDLIIETAESARTFKDLFYRARIQTLAANALWPHDEERARAMFRRAWEAASAHDKSEEEAEELESGVPSSTPMTDARDEVLAMAAARDSKLADAFLKELLAEKTEQSELQKNQAHTVRRTPWREISALGQRRLELANDLLQQNNPRRAADIAAPVISEGESADLMAFVTHLREADNGLGEAFYLRLVESVMSSSETDANSVLLLSSQVISPWLLIVVDERGSIQFRRLDSALTAGTHLPIVSRQVQSAFYNLSASILLRPLVPRAGQNMTPDTIAIYFAIARLLPGFENVAPRFVTDLRLRYSTLASGIEAGRREILNSQIEVNSLTPPRPGDPLRPQIEQLGRARDAQDRDRISLGIVKRAALDKLWDRARSAALEIEDSDLRRAALSFIAVTQIADLLRAFGDDKEEDFDGMARFVRKSDVPPLASAWGLAQAAVIAKRKGDVKSARALLDEAVTYAARTPAGTWQRMAAYTAIARLALQIDIQRAWQIMPEVIGAANACENLVGDEDSIDIDTVGNDGDENVEQLNIESDVFRIDGLFEAMAQLDYEKALISARSLGRELPRAFASLAISKAMLKNDKAVFRG